MGCFYPIVRFCPNSVLDYPYNGVFNHSMPMEWIELYTFPLSLFRMDIAVLSPTRVEGITLVYRIPNWRVATFAGGAELAFARMMYFSANTKT